MTKADIRVKKSLTKIRHALCKILSSTAAPGYPKQDRGGKIDWGFFYAILATIHHHRTYFGAVVRHYGRCAVIGDMLELASEMLWQDYLTTKGNSAVPYKRRFMQAYRKYCHEQLSRIVIRWILSYSCSESYYHAYTMKLKHLAELFTFGEDSAEKFREILERKPVAKTYYPYDKREWDKLG